ncbi:nucleotide sugar dehydrogenase [bacterium]|nr:nucleotide sugar dehydrogenase [bacterium]
MEHPLLQVIHQGDAKAGVIGLGYVGLPLCLTAARKGLSVTGFDVDESKCEAIRSKRSYLKHIGSEQLGEPVDTGRFKATSDFERLGEMDVIVICVPTPLTKHREPDLSYLEQTGETIAKTLRAGQLIILESTTYPGTTDDVLRPILEKSGLTAGEDFFLAFSPEREDPGNENFTTHTIPKIVGADGEVARAAAEAFYSIFIESVVPVSCTRTAEAVKLTENIFRSVNIALVNELKVIYGEMGVDIWEVIEGAKSKPFGYMPFYPGPGLGGHCIPIDPFYLTWKAKEYDRPTRFIELAGEINTSMPYHVVQVLAGALDQQKSKGLNGAKILILGIAYKKNVDDMRESPALKIIEVLEAKGAQIEFLDPYVPTIPMTREHSELAGRTSIEGTSDQLADFDACLIVTDHDGVDYRQVVSKSSLVVDTRNAIRSRGIEGGNVVLA